MSKAKPTAPEAHFSPPIHAQDDAYRPKQAANRSPKRGTGRAGIAGPGRYSRACRDSHLCTPEHGSDRRAPVVAVRARGRESRATHVMRAPRGTRPAARKGLGLVRLPPRRVPISSPPALEAMRAAAARVPPATLSRRGGDIPSWKGTRAPLRRVEVDRAAQGCNSGCRPRISRRRPVRAGSISRRVLKDARRPPTQSPTRPRPRPWARSPRAGAPARGSIAPTTSEAVRRGLRELPAGD